MSLLMPQRPARRRADATTPGSPTETATPQEWHVGLSREGMFPHHEAACPCAKAACGLAIPRAETPCRVHQGQLEYVQMHPSSDCEFPRKGWRRRRNRH